MAYNYRHVQPHRYGLVSSWLDDGFGNVMYWRGTSADHAAAVAFILEDLH